MSARGLAINTASEGGEEFPYFTDFWLVRPDPQQRNLTIYAVLDSPSVAGAYQFEVRPGSTTQVQVSGELYPRRAIEKIGIGALTSMYLYGENSNGRRFDDFRPEVHDSDGLQTQLGTGEWSWRPLVNPHTLRVNRFMDEHPRGYGLVQRDRDPTHYRTPNRTFTCVRAIGLSLWATGARAASSWWRFRPMRKSTTILSPTGSRR